MQSSELHKDMNTSGVLGVGMLVVFYLCRVSVSSHLALNTDVYESRPHLTYAPSQLSDSSQACQVVLNKHKLVAGGGGNANKKSRC